MIGITTKKAPTPLAVVPYFIGSSVSFLIFGIFFFLLNNKLNLGFLQPEIIALTHIATLGIITMMTMGTLHQFIPVVFQANLRYQKLAFGNFFLFIFSLILFIFSFYTHRYFYFLIFAASLTAISIWIFIFNIIATYIKAKKKDIAARFILTALFWLFLTTVYGLLQAYNFKYSFLGTNTLSYLKIHIIFGLIGWLFLLIIGISSIIIPMFLISHRFVDKNKLKYSYVLINAGIIIAWINYQLTGIKILTYIYWILIITGILFFMIYIFQSFKFRKKKLDIAMKHALVAFIFALFPLLLSAIVLFNKDLNIDLPITGISIFFILSIILGVYINLIMGITYRTLPFLVWLYKFQKYLGKAKVPKPEQLYKERIGNIQFYSYFLMLLTIFTGMVLNNNNLLNISAILMLLSATLFNVNVFIIIFKKHRINLNR